MKSFKILILLSIFSVLGMAENYEVSVTHKGSNIYKIDTTNAFIQTWYCYEYVYSENAFLEMHGHYGEIIFLDSGGKCDVKGVYSKVNQSAGKYSVTISHEDENWYRIWGQDMYVKTQMYLSLALGEEAVLSLNAYSSGTMYVDGDQCMVESIYGRQNL